MPHECTNCGRTFPDGSKEMLSGCPDCGGNKFQFAPKATATQSERAGGSTVDSTSADQGAVDSDSPGENGVATRAAETVRDWVSSDSAEDRSETGHGDHAPDVDGTPATPETDRSTDMDEFAEWPDTARRPEDRSTAATDTAETARSPSGSGQPSPDSTTETVSDADLSIGSDEENTAQADARSGVVSRDDLPSEPVGAGDGTEPGGDPSRSVGETNAQPPDHGRVVSEPSAEQPSIEDLRAELNEQFESIKIVSPGQYELNLMELYNREEYIISLQEDGRYVIDVPDSWRGNDAE